MGQGLEQSRGPSRFFDGSQKAEQPAIINQEFLFLIENVQLGVVFLAGKYVADFLSNSSFPTRFLFARLYTQASVPFS